MAKPAVVIDLEKLKIPYCGLGQVAHYLGKAVVQEIQKRDLHLTIFAREQDLEDFQGLDSITPGVWKKEVFRRLYRWAIPKPKPSIQLWHSIHQQVKYLPLDTKVPLVLTIHDLNYLREKSWTKTKRYHNRIQRLIHRAHTIATGSHFVADEIREHFDMDGKSLNVIYNGTYDESDIEPTQLKIIDGSKPFLFSIGQIVPKKNFHVLVDLITHLPDHQLVIAGNSDTEYANFVLQRAQELGVADRVFLPGYVTDGERQWLYHNCEAFAFPSLNEGFGLPPIEAMSVGKPVFLAKRTSLPEVGGPHAFYWDEFSGDYLHKVYQDGMQKFNSDAQFKDRLMQHAAQFTWEEAAKQYVDLYETIIGEVTNTSSSSSRKQIPAAA
ncbi:MAG: glycosyltransferase family 4 protein [Pirellulales bacterium]